MPELPEDPFQRDWQQAVHSTLLTARFAAWRLKAPALAQFDDPAALVRFMRVPGSRAEKDAILCALLIWAKHEPAGARVVLQTIWPGLLRLTARIMPDGREREELRSIMYLAVWEGIRDYPVSRRPRRVAANLLLDTMHRTLVELGRESAWLAARSSTGIERHGHETSDELASDVDSLIDEAVRAGAVSAQEAETILESRIDGVELAELARRAGVSYNTMKLRRQRAERRLLLFLGYRAVPRGQQNRPFSFARVAGAGPLGPAG
jgi:DNA-directed RNA polymerase specialized sigma24 family protein